MPESLLRRIAADPGKLIQAAACRPVKIGRESLIVEAELTVGDRSMPVAVKQYRPRTLWKALAAIFRPAKAMENWRKAEFLLARDIATPRPLLACQPRGWTTSEHQFPGHAVDRRCGEPASLWLANRRPTARRATSRRRAMCRGTGPTAWADACRRRGPSRSQGRQSAGGRRSRQRDRLPGRSRRPSTGRASQFPAAEPAIWPGWRRGWLPILGSRGRSAGVFSARTSGSFPGVHRLEAAVASNRQGNRGLRPPQTRSAVKRCYRQSEQERN